MRQRTQRTFLFLAGAALLAASGCSGEPPAEDQLTDKVPAQVLADVSSGNPRDLIVVFADPALVSPSLSDQPRDVGDDGDLALRAAAYGQMKKAAIDAAPAGGLEVRRSYENLPVLFVSVRDREALSSLAQRPEVVRIVEDRSYEIFDNLALIHATEAIAKGKDGAGVSVAVLDTGLDYTRAAFGSCTAPGAPAACKVAYEADLAPNDKALDANGHGTNVAGIVSRVAPGALDGLPGPGLRGRRLPRRLGRDGAGGGLRHGDGALQRRRDELHAQRPHRRQGLLLPRLRRRRRRQRLRRRPGPGHAHALTPRGSPPLPSPE